MSDSRSRSRARFFGEANPRVHSTGRGGAGNIQPGDTDETDLSAPHIEGGVYVSFLPLYHPSA